MSISFEEKNKFEEISLNTIECEFYDNGQTLIQYLDGLKGNIVQKYETFLYTGNVKEYYRNGKTRFAGKYKDGKMWRGTFFDEKNEPKIIRHGNIFIPNEKNQIDGKEIDFYGRTIFEGKYEITKKNGEEYEEYRNGLLKVYNKETNNVSEEFKGDFKNGNKYAGIEKIFDKENRKITYEFAVKYDKNNKTKRNGSILGIEGKKVDDNTKLLNNNILCFTNKNNNFISDEFDGKEYDLQSNKLVFDGKYCIDKDNTLYDRANGTEYIDGKRKFEGSYKKGVRSKGTEFCKISGNPEFEGIYNNNGDRLEGIVYYDNKNRKVEFEGKFFPEIKGKEYNKEGKLVYEGTYYKYKKRKKGTIYDGQTIEYGKKHVKEDLQKAVVEKDIEYLKNGDIWLPYENKPEKGEELDSNNNVVFSGKIKDGEYLEGKLYNITESNDLKKNKILVFEGKFYKIDKYGQKIEVREGKFFNKYGSLSFIGSKEPLDNGFSKPIDGTSYHYSTDNLCKKILFINGYEIDDIKSPNGNKIYEKFKTTNPEKIKLKQNKVYNIKLYSRQPLEITHVYEGQFLNNNFHGKGTLCYYDGENDDFFKEIKKTKENLKYKYEGRFFLGNRSGNGIEHDNNKIYKGEFKAGLKHGNGILLDEKNKIRLEGIFIDNEPYKVKEYYNNKFVFEGIYKDNKRWEGKGQEYNDKKNKIFDGEYKNGLRWNGKGKEYDKNGKLLFEGTYKEGLRFGYLPKENNVKIKSMPAKINLNTITYEKLEEYLLK